MRTTHRIALPLGARWLLPAVLVLVGMLVAVPFAGMAQDDAEPATQESGPTQEQEGQPTDEAEAPPPVAPIVSTRIGEVPTTGGRRPGPFNLAPPPIVRQAGIAPIALTIEKAAVDAGIERLRVVDGVMQDPTGPWVVAWYENLGALGEHGNVVLAGHIDFWNVGPAVFYSISLLSPGDEIVVTGEDGEVYTYVVDWVRQYDAENAPLDEIVGDTGADTLTLITCGGTFDYTNAHYLQRTVVRAERVETPPPADEA
jgi:LPXTG-site transpeptidase (sortase) family protein